MLSKALKNGPLQNMTENSFPKGKVVELQVSMALLKLISKSFPAVSMFSRRCSAFKECPEVVATLSHMLEEPSL